MFGKLWICIFFLGVALEEASWTSFRKAPAGIPSLGGPMQIDRNLATVCSAAVFILVPSMV